MTKNYLNQKSQEKSFRSLLIFLFGITIASFIIFSNQLEYFKAVFNQHENMLSKLIKYPYHFLNELNPKPSFYSSERTFNSSLEVNSFNYLTVKQNKIDNSFVLLTKKNQQSDTSILFREYADICSLLLDIWSLYSKNEVQGYIANNGNLIVTSIGDSWSVHGPKPIYYKNQYYIAWNKNQNLESIYKDAIQYSGSNYIFLPIKAMFHTHVISGTLSEYDQQVAKKYQNIKHLLFERTRISEFNQYGIIKTYKGNIFNVCQLIQE